MTRNARTTLSMRMSPISSDWCASASSTRADESGRPAHVIAAFDTELFGHWWYEGPVWLERVLRALPEAGVRVGTLSDAIADGFVGSPVELPPSSWGSGKDWQVWAGEMVADLVQLNSEVVDTALTTVDKALGETDIGAGTKLRRRPDPARDAVDGVQRLAVHGQQGFGRGLRALPRTSARTRHPRDRRRDGVGSSRPCPAPRRRLEPRRRIVRVARRKAPAAMTHTAWAHTPVGDDRVCTRHAAFCRQLAVARPGPSVR